MRNKTYLSIAIIPILAVLIISAGNIFFRESNQEVDTVSTVYLPLISTPPAPENCPAPIDSAPALPTTSQRIATQSFIPGQVKTAGTEYHVTVNGRSSGNGSISNPWDLDSALLESSRTKPGDIIWVHGGTYHPVVEPAKYNIKLVGGDNNPIIIRTYPGERVTIEGGIQIYQPNVVFWGFEVMSSDTDRTASESGSHPSDLNRAGGIVIFNRNIMLINNIIHDGGSGITASFNAPNATIYGNLSYNAGWQGPDRGHGHGFYGQNDTGTKYIYENIIFNNFGSYSFHIYREGGPLNNFILYGNAAINDTFLVGGLEPADNISVLENHIYNAKTRLGYSSKDNGTITISNNWFYGEPGEDNLELKWWDKAIVTNNCSFSQNDTVVLMEYPSSHSSYVWNNNIYRSTDSTPFFYNGSARSWSQWRSSTGFDSSSNFKAEVPKGLSIYVRPNLFEAKRGHVFIYNWDSQNTVNVDISSLGLAIGDSYTLHNALDYYVNPIQGVYNGAPIPVRMTNWSVAKPIGWSETLGPTTFPKFGTFVLTSP